MPSRRIILPILAVVLCVGLAGIALALLPPARGQEHTSFAASMKIIGTTVYERVILPRPPRAISGYRNWFQAIALATPLLLTGLAVALAFRAGVLNIGAQGQYIAGAIASTAIGVYAPLHSPPLLIALHLLGAMLAGALVAAIAAVLYRWRNVSVVLSTLLLNFAMLEFLRYLLQGPMRARSDAGTLLDPQSPPLPEAAQLPMFFQSPTGQGIGLGTFLAIAAAILLAWMLRRTVLGYRMIVVGQNPTAARFAGIHVSRISVLALAMSGALAGLAGGIHVAAAPSYTLFPDLGTNAVGFTGIVVALLAGLSPIGAIVSALFFGVLTSAFRALEASPLDVHSSTGQAVQGMLVIAILAVQSPRIARWIRTRNGEAG